MPPRLSVPAPSFGAGGGGAGAGPGGWGQLHARGAGARFAFIPLATSLVSGGSWGSARVSRGGVAAGLRSGGGVWNRAECRRPKALLGLGGAAMPSTWGGGWGGCLRSPGHSWGRGWPADGDVGSPTSLGTLLPTHTFCPPSPNPPAHPHSPKVSNTLHCFPSPWQRCRSRAWCGGGGTKPDILVSGAGVGARG